MISGVVIYGKENLIISIQVSKEQAKIYYIAPVLTFKYRNSFFINLLHFKNIY